ncbi:hypothetical protein [Echinicola sp. 20G]|uniref:hypothetical protein n=1 Tax=Echinicola sp. 20G TaxID=2781961 RepID=UPI001910874C|nr:hypothetical protein [Echinicola sp. 20G]
MNNTLITANDFRISEIKTGNKIHRTYYYKHKVCDNVIFKDVENKFQGDIVFNEVKFVNKNEFNLIDKTIYINKCNFSLGKISFDGNNNTLSFDTSYGIEKLDEYLTTIIFKNLNDSTRDFKFSEEWIVKRINLLNFTVKDVYIKSNKVASLQIQNFNNSKSRIFNESSSLKSIKLETAALSSLTHKGGLLNSIRFIDVNFKDINIFSFKCDDLKELYIKNTNIKSFIVNSVAKEEVNVNRVVLLDNFYLTKFEYNYLNPASKNIRINELEINSDTSINLKKIDFKTVKLTNEFTKNSSFVKCQINQLIFNDFSTTATFIFKDITVNSENSKLIIYNSILNNVTFNPSIFHLYDSIEFKKSKLDGLEVNSFEFVKSKTISEYSDKGKIDRVELIRFFKNLVDGDKNLNLYQKYRAMEYNQMLKEGTDLNCGEKLILIFNKITNNHTTQWYNSAILIIIFAVCYGGYLFYYLSSTNQIDKPDIILQNSVILLSPVKYLNSLEECIFPTWLYVFDIFYKFIIGSLLFQMVAAFRKFHK